MARGKKTGGGTRKGIPNKATAVARNVYAALLEANKDKLQAALDEVYVKDKARWFALMLDMSEFAQPKLARTEVSGNDGAPLNFTVFVPPKAD